MGNLLNARRDGARFLQLLIFNEEFLGVFFSLWCFDISGQSQTGNKPQWDLAQDGGRSYRPSLKFLH